MRGTPAGSQVVLASGFGLRLVIGLAITAVVGRVLSPAEFGFFALVGSLFFAARFLFDLGTGTIAVREIARAPERERAILEGLLGWRRLCGLVLGAFVFAYAWTEGDPGRRQVLFGVSVALPLLAPGALAPLFTLRQSQAGPTLVRTIAQLGVLAAALSLQALGVAGAAFAWLPVGRELFNVAGVRRCALRLVDYRPRAGIRGRGLRPFLAMSLVQGSAMLFFAAIFHADVFLVRGLRGEAELGAYAAALRPLQPLLALPALLLLPLVPRLAQAAARERAAFRRLVGGLATAALLAGGVCALLGVLAAPFVLRVLYGDGYAESVDALRWLSVALGCAVLAGPLAATLTADRGERALLWIYAGGFGVNLIANVVLLPRFGFVAAAFTTAGTQAVIVLALGVVLLRRGAVGRPPGASALWRELATPASVRGESEGEQA